MSLRADIGTADDAPNCGRSFGVVLAWATEPLADVPFGCSQDLVRRSALVFSVSIADAADAPPPAASTSNSASTMVLSTAGKVASNSSIIFLLSCMDFCILDVVPGIIEAANRRSSFIAEAY
jgi:hypothetical protein